jgi:hypothetical protein
MKPTHRSMVYRSVLVTLCMAPACGGSDKTTIIYMNATGGSNSAGATATNQDTNTGDAASAGNSGVAANVGGSSTANRTSDGGATQATRTDTVASASGGEQPVSTNSTGGAVQQSSTGTAGGSTGCPTVNGSYTESTTFGTAGSTSPYQGNVWSSAIAVSTPPLVQTTIGASGVDCSAGCARFTTTWPAGTGQYAGGNAVNFLAGATNMLNETVTINLAVVVTRADGATDDPPVEIDLAVFKDFSGQATGYWTASLGSLSSLAEQFHTFTQKLTDIGVPKSQPSATICASAVTALAIQVGSTASVTQANAGTLDIYIQSISVAP